MPGVQIDPSGAAAPIDPPAPDAPPPTAPPPQQQQPYAPYGGPAATPPSPAPTPVDPTWDGVAAGYRTELEDLALQWQQVAGFGITISEQQLRWMADVHVVTLRDLSGWVWNNAMPNDLKQRSPWLAFGLDQTSWNRQLSDYMDSYEQITGQRPAFDPAIVTAEQAGASSQFFWDAFRGNLTQSGLRERLLHDEGIQKTYGWVKFGLNFDDFQQRKTDMRLTFGMDLSNEQVVQQLQYLHQAQGASRAVQAQAPAGQQQGPVAPTEVEVR